MEPSPLTQQSRPESFQQKIVELYHSLFAEDDDGERSEGFWREFFLLRPDKINLQRILGELTADDLLHLQSQTRSLFSRAIVEIKRGKGPSDEIALETLSTFFAVVLTKKFTNPSSDVISVVTGLDQVDSIFTDFVAALDNVIRSGRTLDVRNKAIETAVSVASGAYQTSLISYFTHRDLFPSLMKYIQDADDATFAFKPFVLLGLLSNYNKFEFQNPYRLRLEDFVKETTIERTIDSIGYTCTLLRDDYIAIQDDLPESWSLTSTLGYLGLGALSTSSAKTTAAPASSPDTARSLFAALPSPSASILLATYSFAASNKLFCFNLLSQPVSAPSTVSPLSSYLSLTSYLLTHAHRSHRTSTYAYLNLLVVRLLTEDQVLCKRICQPSTPTDQITVRLCRQRTPHLPLIRSARPIAAILIDMMIDGLNHNLRRRLDIDLYILMLTILTRLISHLSRSRTRLTTHWPLLWRALLALIKFLVTYASDLNGLPRLRLLSDTLTNLIALALLSGDGFLPSTTDYDDLFYKLVQSGETSIRFRDVYNLHPSSDNLADANAKTTGTTTATTSSASGSIAILINVHEYFHRLLDEKGSKLKNLRPADVADVIRGGYDSLDTSLHTVGLDLAGAGKYREVDEKKLLKTVARYAVADARRLVLES